MRPRDTQSCLPSAVGRERERMDIRNRRVLGARHRVGKRRVARRPGIAGRSTEGPSASPLERAGVGAPAVDCGLAVGSSAGAPSTARGAPEAGGLPRRPAGPRHRRAHGHGAASGFRPRGSTGCAADESVAKRTRALETLVRERRATSGRFLREPPEAWPHFAASGLMLNFVVPDVHVWRPGERRRWISPPAPTVD